MALTRDEALARIRRLRDWAGMRQAPALGWALDCLVLASGLAGSGCGTTVPQLAGRDLEGARRYLEEGGVPLTPQSPPGATAVAVSALVWARDELEELVHGGSAQSAALPGGAP